MKTYTITDSQVEQEITITLPSINKRSKQLFKVNKVGIEWAAKLKVNEFVVIKCNKKGWEFA